MRPLGAFPQVDGEAAGSQLREFEQTLALLGDRADIAPVLLASRTCTGPTPPLDLVVFLAHNLGGRRVLLATYAPAGRLGRAHRRLADGVRRSGSALVLELNSTARR